ncbi:hypothetical protein EV127DRAFT_414812 [Xylaria flabelliformis]|nr:hypothetical protein EV127DRAFT_414812 [Xylaria flabelliformis]
MKFNFIAFNEDRVRRCEGEKVKGRARPDQELQKASIFACPFPALRVEHNDLSYDKAPAFHLPDLSPKLHEMVENCLQAIRDHYPYVTYRHFHYYMFLWAHYQLKEHVHHGKTLDRREVTPLKQFVTQVPTVLDFTENSIFKVLLYLAADPTVPDLHLLYIYQYTCYPPFLDEDVRSQPVMRWAGETTATIELSLILEFIPPKGASLCSVTVLQFISVDTDNIQQARNDGSNGGDGVKYAFTNYLRLTNSCV